MELLKGKALIKQGNDNRTSSPEGINPSLPPCPMPFYNFREPIIYVLPHPPPTHQMNLNENQVVNSERNYQRFPTQTDTPTENYPTKFDNMTQSSSGYPRQSNQVQQHSQIRPNLTSQHPQQPTYFYPAQASEQQPISAYSSQSNQNDQRTQSPTILTPQKLHQSVHSLYDYSGRPSTSQSNNPTQQQPQPTTHPYYYYPAQPGVYQPYYGAWQGTAPPPHSYSYGAQYLAQPPKATDTPMIREGGFRRPVEEPEPEGWTGFLDKKIRAKFIRKVYIILTLQLLFTLGIIALFIYEPNVKKFVQKHKYLTYVAMAVFFSVYIGLACFQSVRRRFPMNIIALVVFTMAMSYMAATISTTYNTDTVLIAVGICAAVCLTVTIFSFYTKFDFTTCGGILCILMLILFLCGIITIFFPNTVMRMIYAGLGATVFTFMLAYDTQMMMGGKHYELSPEEYVFAAIQIYIDIVYIFLYLLMLLGGTEE